MLVKLSKIQATSKPVRKTRDVKKMDELVASIKEQGVIVPPKLRLNGGTFDVVYGHRRIDAARQAGLEEIECFVMDVPKEKLGIQGLTENVVREDMYARDIAEELQKQVDEGLTPTQVGDKYGWGAATVISYLTLLKFDVSRETITHKHVTEARAGTETDEDAAIVLKKASKETLSKRETRKLAETVTDARKFGGQRAVKRVLATPYAELKQIEQVPEPPKRKLVPVKTDVVFSWVRDERVIRGDEGFKAIGAAIRLMELQYEKDIGSALAMLKKYKSFLVTLVARVDKAIEVVGSEQ